MVGNAIKFTQEGEVVIRVHLLEDQDQRVTLKVEVIDTGIGIESGKIEDLFMPFIQEDGSTTRKFGGTGLGLSISKHLVEAMAGEIGALSEKDEGTTFWFSLVMEKQSSASAEHEESLVRLEGVKVLVVGSPRSRGPLRPRRGDQGRAPRMRGTVMLPVTGSPRLPNLLLIRPIFSSA